MGHYASEMGYERNKSIDAWVAFRNENDYVKPQHEGAHSQYDIENTMMHHLPCGLIVGNMVKHLDYCPAKN